MGGGAGASADHSGGGGSSYIALLSSATTEAGSNGASFAGGSPGGTGSIYYPGDHIGRGGVAGSQGSSGFIVLADHGHCPGIEGGQLHSQTTYKVSVGAVNGAGAPLMSTQATFTTL